MGIAQEIEKRDQARRNCSERDNIREYIASMAVELAALAKKQDAGFLAHLLNLAVDEAKSSKVRIARQP
jgi:hypothetical protein